MSNPGSLSGKAEPAAAPLLSRSAAAGAGTAEPSVSSREPSWLQRALNQPKIPWFTDLIVRHRRWLFAFSVLLYVVSFNGRWRVGLDSATYRGLARSIARGGGYQFTDFGSHHAYPGLPMMLAGVNKLVGENVFRPALAQFLIVLMALATVWLTYRVVKLHYPEWIAVSVACGLAVNSRFLELSNELLTDVPFLLGVLTAFYGWELLRAAGDSRKRAGAISVLTIGLLLAAVMRPTFWVLGIAWLCACIWGLFTSQRKFYLTCLFILLTVWVAFALVDPRERDSSGNKIFAPLGGGYEREVITLVTESSSIEADSRVAVLASRIRQELPKLFKIHLPVAFLGQVLPPFLSMTLTALLIASSFVLIRRHPVWFLLVIFTIGVTVMLSTAPRYYVMIMPPLILASLLLVKWLTDRIPGGWGDLVLFLWLGFVTVENLTRIVPFVISQHAVSISDSSLKFYEKYRDGRFLPIIEMADVIHARVPPGERVIAPAAPIMAYLSDRQVMMERDILPLRRSARRYPEYLRAEGIRFAVFPASAYQDKDPELARLIRFHVIYPTRKIARTSGMILARCAIYVPPGDWRDGPSYPTLTKKFAKPIRKSATTRKATTQALKKKSKPTRATTRAKRKLRPAPTTQPSTSQAAPASRRQPRAATTTTSMNSANLFNSVPSL